MFLQAPFKYCTITGQPPANQCLAWSNLRVKLLFPEIASASDASQFASAVLSAILMFKSKQFPFHAALKCKPTASSGP